MPFWWPFGRRRRKNKGIKDHGAATEKHLARDSPASPLLNEKRDAPATPVSRRVTDNASSPPSRQPLSQRVLTSPPRSQPHTANTSDFPTENTSLEDITALPVTRKVTESSQRESADRPDARSPPSLRSKRSITNDPQLSKRKSTRKRKDQSARESQIKAMSSPIPIPKRYGADTKIRAALIEGSATSLPRAASVRSSITALSDNQYEVGGIDVFSPRPTIRHSIYNNPASNVASRAVSRTEDRTERDISPRQVLKESKTIDDLADNYDANTLRELMDRDRRRRERKRKAQEERARRRLEQYAEASEPGPSRRQERAPAQKVGRLDTGFFSSEAGPSNSQKQRATERPIKETQDLSQRNPFADNESEVITPTEDPTVNIAQEVRYSQMSASPPLSPVQHVRKASTFTQSTDPRSASASNIAEPVADLDRRASEAGTKRSGPLSSLFRRSRMARHPSGDSREAMPSEPSFSNTSRESMSRQLPPVHLREQTSAPRVRSGTPTRTMSKFREDLPELPTAPLPIHNTENSEQAATPPLTARQREKQPVDLPMSSDLSETRAESPSVAVLSQSLASVDSEGSWLSGRPPKRSSLQSTPLNTETRPGQGQSSAGKIEGQDAEYFERSKPAQTQSGASGIASALAATDSQAVPGQSEEIQRTGNVSRRPTVVNQDRTKSSEGLLREIKGVSAEAESEAASPVEVEVMPPSTSDPPPGTVAASSTGDANKEDTESDESGDSESPSKPSVALAHTRSVSRGSAKLLDITRKGSVDIQQPPPDS